MSSFIFMVRETDLFKRFEKYKYVVTLKSIITGQLDLFVNCVLSPAGKTFKDDTFHFVLEKADGTLDKLIRCPRELYSGFKRYCLQLALGIRYLHSQDIIHRDIKPSNILWFSREPDLVTNKGTKIYQGVLNISDLGLSKPFTYQCQNTPSSVTCWYRPPKVAQYLPNYDYKLDVWSLGCVYYEMVTQVPMLAGAQIAISKSCRRLLLCQNPLPLPAFKP